MGGPSRSLFEVRGAPWVALPAEQLCFEDFTAGLACVFLAFWCGEGVRLLHGFVAVAAAAAVEAEERLFF